MLTKDTRELASIPVDFDHITDNIAHEKRYIALEVVETPTFPNDITSNVVNGKGKNLSSYNGKLMQGAVLRGDWHKVQLLSGSVTAYYTL